MKKQQIGIVGMAVMGKNLALNISDHGFSIAIFNRTVSTAEEVAALVAFLLSEDAGYITRQVIAVNGGIC